jgi:hemolysin D
MSGVAPRGAARRVAALGFQSELDSIVAEQPPWLLRQFTLGLALMMLLTIGLAWATRVDIVVTGRGRLAVDHPTNVVMPLDRAILRALNVRPGDIVHRGDVLALLDSTFTRADLDALQAERRSKVAEIARVQAELDNVPYEATPAAESQTQLRLFDQRRLEYSARVTAFEQSVAHDKAEQDTARHQQSALARQMDIARQVRDMRENLMRRAVGSRLQFLDADTAFLRAGSELRTATDKIGELGHAVLSDMADQRSFMENWRRADVETLAATSNELAQVAASLRKAEKLQDMATVRAPEDGTILEVAARGPGSVLREAEPLLTLLPARAGLIAEITIKSADIGYVRTGDASNVKIDAYPYQQHGALAGHVRAIAAASSEPPGPGAGDGSAVHRVVVALGDARLADLPNGTGPMPGMTVSADVRVGTRSVLAYFLAPITRGFAQSLHEP